METDTKIEHFKVIKPLGKGMQGVVYLCMDLRLKRLVALKMLQIHGKDRREQMERLLAEAQTVSRLQHPNIELIFEAGYHKQVPFLVFEYIDGLPLRALCAKSGPLEPRRACVLMTQILSGIAAAHGRGIVHRDLNPSNILVSPGDVIKVVDFGVAGMGEAQKGLVGTPRYISPEQIAEEPVTPQTDIFAAGLIFYEILTRHHPFEADNDFAVMYKISNDQAPPLSRFVGGIDPGLEGIVLKAMEKQPGRRYGTALEMKEALDGYLADLESRCGERYQEIDHHSTVEFLLRRMAVKKDFPALSSQVLEVADQASSESEGASARKLTNVVLRDPALTSKLLKLANSALHAPASGSVSTVSRAVLVLGLDQVRQAALSLLVLEHLADEGGQKSELLDSLAASFLGSLIACGLGKRLGCRQMEEAFVCAMLHNLGEQLVIYYFPDEYRAIMDKIPTGRRDDEQGSRAVLGVSFSEMAMAVMRSWKYPEKIVESLRRVASDPWPALQEGSDLDQLRLLASFSNDISRVVGESEAHLTRDALMAVMGRYRKAVPIRERELLHILLSVWGRFERDISHLNITPLNCTFLSRAGTFVQELLQEIPPRVVQAVLEEMEGCLPPERPPREKKEGTREAGPKGPESTRKNPSDTGISISRMKRAAGNLFSFVRR